MRAKSNWITSFDFDKLNFDSIIRYTLNAIRYILFLMYSTSQVLTGWTTFTKRKGSLLLALSFGFVLFTTLCFIKNGAPALQAFTFDSLSYLNRVTLFIKTLYAVTTFFDFTTLTITILGSLLGGVSLAAGYEYFLIRKQAIDKGNVALTTFGYALVIIGIHCASCGVIFATILISIFGNLLAPELITSLSVWFGIGGISIQIVVLWILLGKLSRPLIC